MIRSRKIKAFEESLSPCTFPAANYDQYGQLLVKECLSGLALMPLQPDLTSCIWLVRLYVPLDGEACTAFARAIKLKNLRTMSSLRFSIDISCDSTSIEDLGRVIHPSFTPSLSSLTLSVNKEEEGESCHVKLWRSFFAAMPLEGRTLFRHLTIGHAGDKPNGIWVVLQALGAPENPVSLGKVTDLELHREITVDDLIALSTVLITGALPSLAELLFHGE